MLNDIEKILILSPHTDDAELGCGGTISKLIENGKQVLWIVFSAAEDSLPKGLPPDSLVKEFLNVINYFKLAEENYKIYNFKVRKLNELRQEILENLVKIRNEFKPDLVIGPSLHDFHQDHSVVSHEMIRAFKTSCSIICYELPWNHIQFDTQFFVKLSPDHLKIKTEILDFYKTQQMIARHYFSEEFIRGLAAARGAQVGAKYAEAFEVIRWIDK
ncbi:MAG: PIG-L family deacetylase [Bacteroidales bacterium]|nr:PIG-L family deacetylase [Bacteroidales bacterium]MCF8402554.1 PIG-L family deacetylase [Bacteroidales bacterium]